MGFGNDYLGLEAEKRIIEECVINAVSKTYADVKLSFTFVQGPDVFVKVVCKREQELELVITYKEFLDSLAIPSQNIYAVIVGSYVANEVIKLLTSVGWNSAQAKG
ncbi:hypothetical protein ACAW74_05080 [Fibrella sp. WM1]|uniref:hypothetical protein n=1 Tax=Fibrella musci TaxID=3242485 RepID=UPI0035215952